MDNIRGPEGTERNYKLFLAKAYLSKSLCFRPGFVMCVKETIGVQLESLQWGSQLCLGPALPVLHVLHHFVVVCSHRDKPLPHPISCKQKEIIDKNFCIFLNDIFQTNFDSFSRLKI